MSRAGAAKRDATNAIRRRPPHIGHLPLTDSRFACVLLVRTRIPVPSR